MNVTYEDRNGKTWRFNLNATPYQTLLFRRVLGVVRTVTQRVALTLAYLADLDENDAFLSDVEGTVLSALAEKYGATPPPAPAPPPRPRRTEAPQERAPYWWENL